jgi:hypothetical protein
MLERLRRALDRMACAQSVLESMRTDGAAAGIDGSAAELRMRDAVGLLARGGRRTIRPGRWSGFYCSRQRARER